MPTRKASWAIAIWTIFMAVAIVAAALGIGRDCAGLAGTEFSSCQSDAWMRGVTGLGLLGFLWFVGFVPLWFIWRASRPTEAAGT